MRIKVLSQLWGTRQKHSNIRFFINIVFGKKCFLNFFYLFSRWLCGRFLLLEPGSLLCDNFIGCRRCTPNPIVTRQFRALWCIHFSDISILCLRLIFVFNYCYCSWFVALCNVIVALKMAEFYRIFSYLIFIF